MALKIKLVVFENTQKNDFVTVTKICDTDNRALFLYRLTVSVEIIIFVAFTIFLSPLQYLGTVAR